MIHTGLVKVLLVEDDEDDYIIARDLFSEMSGQRFVLNWVKTFETGLETMCRNQHDVVLVDYRLGAQNGVELLRQALQRGCQSPVILLTGAGERQIDLEAMEAGASDYLVKVELQANSLERSIRYALERKRAKALAAFEQARLAAFGAEVGLLLTRRDSLEAILERCARAMVQYLNATLAQISVFDPRKKVFEVYASAGIASTPNGSACSLPAPRHELETLAQGKPVVIQQLLDDPRMPDQEWVRREGLVSYAAYPLLLEDKLVGLMSILTDHPLTEQICQEMGSVANGIALCLDRKRSEAALDVSESNRKQAELQIQKLAAFPRVNPNPVLEFASDGALTYANDAAHAMARALDRPELSSILPANTGAIVRDCLAVGQNKLREEVNLNGRTITWSFFPVPASQVVHCYGADVTDVLNLEAQFRHAQRLESVGQLAAGIAHDFNNLLTVIQGYSDFLLPQFTADKTAQRALKQISEAAKRAAALTRQLLLFSRKQLIQTQVLDLNCVLQNLANMLPRLLGEDIAFETDYAQDIPQIEADTGMLEQVVMNLAVNARDAMPKGGKLLIRTSMMHITQDYVRHHPDARVGNFCCLAVTDTGCGMERKTLERIFEPFFTTKEVGKGTGLGLATVYGIVKQHQGWVEVSSQVGVGTTFKVYFPGMAQTANQASGLPPVPEKIRGGKEAILLVEDEPALRALVREVLENYQYRVLDAGSGVEALRIWDEKDGKFDLLLTDLVMPEGVTGRELAAQLKNRNPQLKIIFTSGCSAEALGKDFPQGDTTFLPKPYLPSQLAQFVRKCLDDSAKPRPELVAA